LADKIDFSTWWHEDPGAIGFTHAMKMKLLHSEQSPFQKIEIYDHKDFGRVLVLDDLIQASEADEFIYHEMAVHVPVLGRKRENLRALIVGGGDGGLLRELLVHDNIEKVVMAEIDRRVIELSNEYLVINGDYNDPRVELVCDDAARYVIEALGRKEQFDLIFMDITEPVGPSASLFTEEFLDNLVAILKDDGVCIDSDSVFIGKDRIRFLQEASSEEEYSLLEIMRSGRFFPHLDVYRSIVPMYPGAEFGFFLYSKDGYDYSTPYEEHDGKHYNAAVHKGAFALPNWWRNELGFGKKG
jgi:spermidine synthase